MELHNPPNLGLPPLMIEKQSSRAAMERRTEIAAFIQSKQLLDKEFHTLFSSILKDSQFINELLVMLAGAFAKKMIFKKLIPEAMEKNRLTVEQADAFIALLEGEQKRREDNSPHRRLELHTELPHVRITPRHPSLPHERSYYHHP
jgi:hypothetical protein